MSLSFLSAVRRFPLFLPAAKLAAAVLVAMLMAGPVWAQTTVTSNGREGQTTCRGQAEINATNMPFTALSTTSVTVTAPEITWSQVLAPLGDGQAPANAIISVNVFDQTNTGIGNSGAVATISSGSPTYAGGSVTRTGLSANTLYFVEIDIGIAGRQGRTFGRRCFMTGGTYTMTTNPAPGMTSGCFSISPRTPQDVRNCLCGRGNNSPRVLGLFTDETQNQALRDSLGCR